MNILHHKSWHVRNKRNIEKVRRDEEKAADEEKEKERKIAIAESEARSNILRKAAKSKKFKTSSSSSSDDEKSTQKQSKHINFFEDLEAGKKNDCKNADHELELRNEKEKKEKEIGLLTYLGQNSAELNDIKPWYSEARVRDKTKIPKEKSFCEETEKKRKRSMDPLANMIKYIDKTEKYKKSLEPDTSNIKPKNSTYHVPNKNNQPKTMDQLRAERLLREKTERMRQKQLFDKMENMKNPQPIVEVDERKLSYNSRYNPNLGRVG